MYYIYYHNLCLWFSWKDHALQWLRNRICVRFDCQWFFVCSKQWMKMFFGKELSLVQITGAAEAWSHAVTNVCHKPQLEIGGLGKLKPEIWGFSRSLTSFLTGLANRSDQLQGALNQKQVVRYSWTNDHPSPEHSHAPAIGHVCFANSSQHDR